MSIKHTHSFLDKFQGKKSYVSREGLLHLLDLKRKALQVKVKSQDLPQPKHRQSLKSLFPPGRSTPVSSNYNDVPRQSPQSQQERSQKQSNGNAKEMKSIELLPKLKLPTINRSSSQIGPLKKSRTGDYSQGIYQKDAKVQLITPLKLDSHKSTHQPVRDRPFELDEYALNHLQFLNKCELQLRGEKGCKL